MRRFALRHGQIRSKPGLQVQQSATSSLAFGSVVDSGASALETGTTTSLLVLFTGLTGLASFTVLFARARLGAFALLVVPSLVSAFAGATFEVFFFAFEAPWAAFVAFEAP
jgi:hypothetical protein